MEQPAWSGDVQTRCQTCLATLSNTFVAMLPSRNPLLRRMPARRLGRLVLRGVVKVGVVPGKEREREKSAFFEWRKKR